MSFGKKINPFPMISDVDLKNILKIAIPSRQLFIKKIMEYRKINNSILCEGAGISYNTVKNWQSGVNPQKLNANAAERFLGLPENLIYDFDNIIKKGIFGIIFEDLVGNYWDSEDFREEARNWYQSLTLKGIENYSKWETKEDDDSNEEIKQEEIKDDSGLVKDILNPDNLKNNEEIFDKKTAKRLFIKKDEIGDYEKIICLSIARKRGILPICYDTLYIKGDIRLLLIDLLSSTNRTSKYDKNDIEILFDTFGISKWENNIDNSLLVNKNSLESQLFFSYFKDMLTFAITSGECEKSQIVKNAVEYGRKYLIYQNINTYFSELLHMIIDLWEAIKSSYVTFEVLKYIIMSIDYKYITTYIETERLYEFVDIIGRYYNI